jgi:hypothetical protein
MRLILENNNNNNLSVTKLPNTIGGNYWIVNNQKNLLNVEAIDKKWIINLLDVGPIAYTKNLDIVNNPTWILTDNTYQNLGSINVYVRFIEK